MTESAAIWGYLLPGLAFGFAAAAQPGPMMMYFIFSTLKSGWKKTLPAVFAPLVTDGPIALVCLSILGNLPGQILPFIQFAGGLFILYIAFRSAKHWKQNKHEVEGKGISTQGTLLNAIVVNFLNPGPWLGWSLVIGPLFLKGWQENPVNGISLLAGFYGTMFLFSALVIVSFHQMRERIPKLQHLLLGLSVIFLALFGIYQLVTSGISFN